MKKLFIIALICQAILTSCEKEKTNPPANPPVVVIPDTLPTLVTESATYITNKSAALNARVVSLGNRYISERGFCISINANPTVDDQVITVGGSGLGPFFGGCSFCFSANITYNVRAFMRTSGGIAYGNNVTFTTIDDAILGTLPTRNIEVSRGIVSAKIIYSSEAILQQKGFCKSTSPMPMYDNSSNTIILSSRDTFDFDYSLTGLQANTLYYFRSFVKISNTVIYGPEFSFRTAGFTGASGGIVYFDKGEYTNGWRYREIGPVDIGYNGTTLSQWGCSATAVGTNNEPDGQIATNMILQACNEPNCAARVTDNYVLNGADNWYLGSRDEMNTAVNSLNIRGDYWTSTEYFSGYAFSLTTPNGTWKSSNRSVRPIRRF